MNFDELFQIAKTHTHAKVAAPHLTGGLYEVASTVLIDEALQLAQRLQASGLRQGMQVGVQLPNCYEYLLWDLACLQIGAVLHSLPEDMPADKVATVAAKHHAALWVYQHAANFEGISQAVAASQTKEISTFPVSPAATILADADVHSRVYSSGSSGYLKGLDISRRGTEMLISDFVRDFALGEADSHLIFLPLSNYQQRMSVYACLWAGASFKVIHHTTVFQELARYRPSFIIAPPAIYENIHHLLGRAADAKEKLTAFLGGNIRFMITGMAPIRKELLVSFNAHGLNLLEVYGVTETGMIAWNTPQQRKVGAVGRPIHAEHVHFSDEGEIIIKRQFPLSKGYFDSAEEDQRATFLADGSIMTGDIGVLDEEGFLSLSGRKKEIIVTSGGAKFHPEAIERALLDLGGIKQAVVLMSKTDQRLVAVLVCEQAQDEAVLAKINQAIAVLNQSLPSYQRIQRQVFTEVQASVENGMLTRNLKCDRRGVYKYFEAAIEARQGATA